MDFPDFFASLPIAQKLFILLATPGPLFISINNPVRVAAESKINAPCKAFGTIVPTTLGRA